MATTSQDLLDVILSEGYNIYTQVTQALDSLTRSSTSQPASTSAQTTTSSSSRSSNVSSSFRTSPASSSASTTASHSSPTSASSSATSIAGAAVSSATSAASATGAGKADENGGGHNKLAIILGSVLGALALGLLILAILLCCRRRRRHSRKSSTRYGASTPGDDEFERWKHSPRQGHKPSEKGVFVSSVPFTGDRAANRDGHGHEHHNPFTPVPPPPRRSAPNSRAGLTDGTVPGDDPYLMEKGTNRPFTADGSRSQDNSSKGKALALGLGGAAVGAAAMHHPHKNTAAHNTVAASQGTEHTISRKPVRGKSIDHTEPWVDGPPPSIHEPSAFAAGSVGRQSFDSAHSQPVRDDGLVNAPFDHQYAPASQPDHIIPNQDVSDHNHHGVPTTAAALGAAGLGGTALAHQQNKHGRRDSSISRDSQHNTLAEPFQQDHAIPRKEVNEHNHRGAASTAAALGAGALGGAALAHQHNKHNRDSSISRDSQHNTLVASHQHDSDISKTSSSQYSDALPNPPRITPGLHELPSNIPPTPPIRPRHDTALALGAAAPSAAVGSYFTAAHPAYASSHSRSRSRSHSHSRTRSRSSSRHRPHSFPDHPDDYAAYYPNAPMMPPIPSSLSPHRHSRVSSEFGGSDRPLYHMPAPPPPRSDSPPYVPKSIVGDNGYPHMNVPRRRSGSEYDYAKTGVLGPQVAPLPLPMPLPVGSAADDSRQGSFLSGGSGNGNGNGRFPPHLAGIDSGLASPAEHSSSEDSAWRVSGQMPGGWQRTSLGQYPPRGSMDGWGGRSPVSPVESEGYVYGDGFGHSHGGGGGGGGGAGALRRSLQMGRHDDAGGVGRAL